MSVQTWVFIREQKHCGSQGSNSPDGDDRVWQDSLLNRHSSVCRSALVPWGVGSNNRSPAKLGMIFQSTTQGYFEWDELTIEMVSQ